MKCPKCGYVSFDTLSHCKRCGKELPSERAHTDAGNVSDDCRPADTPAHAQESAARPQHIDNTLKSIKHDLDELGPAPGGAGDAFEEQSAETGFGCIIDPHDRPKAGFFIRFVAYAIDSLLLAVISGVLFFIAYRLFKESFLFTADTTVQVFAALYGPFLLISTVIQAFYFIYFHAVTGQTVGKLICGVRVVGTDGSLIGAKRSALRYLGYAISYFVFYLGFIWIAFDRQKQGWHDKIAGSYVVK